MKDDAMGGNSQEGNPALPSVKDASLAFLAQVDGKIRFVCDPADQGFRLMCVEIIPDKMPTCRRQEDASAERAADCARVVASSTVGVEAIALAMEMNVDLLLIDERVGRESAQHLGVSYMG